MNLKDHINHIRRSCYPHLRNIGRVRRNLTEAATIVMVHAFIASRLDHMNSLLYGLPKCLLHKLQKIQNNAARIVRRLRRRDHITEALADLHWLPVQKRIHFKILTTTFKSLHGLAPKYISDLVKPYEPTRRLRSQDHNMLQQPRSRTKTYGDRGYRVCAPRLWNKLPNTIRQIHELESFKSELKTHLFRQAYDIDAVE